MSLSNGTEFEFNGYRYTVAGFLPPTAYDATAYRVVNEMGGQEVIEAIIVEGIVGGTMPEKEALAHRAMSASSYF